MLLSFHAIIMFKYQWSRQCRMTMITMGAGSIYRDVYAISAYISWVMYILLERIYA